MNLTELLNICALGFALFIAISIFNLLLQRTVKGTIRNLLFKFGVFILFSILYLIKPILLRLVISDSLNFGVSAVIDCLWWFSLNFLTNEILTYFIWDRFMPSKGITVSKLLRDLVGFIFIIITIAMIFHFVFEKSVVGLFTASGVMAIILGYSAQSTLGEAFSGIGLNITKQFEQGDWVEINGKSGQVTEINWRFVTLLTSSKNHLTIPNSKISKENITNYSRPTAIGGVLISVQVKTIFSPESVKKMLISAAEQSFSVYPTPPPTASIIDFNVGDKMEIYNVYQLACYATGQNIPRVKNDILSIFWYQCQRIERSISNNINPFWVEYSKEDIQQFLKKMDLFSSLTDDEIVQLEEQSSHNLYGPPERILTQGQSNQSLFLIYKGSVDVFIKTPDDQMIQVATLTDGQYFGEMSLLTGDPAGASIVITSESTIIEIEHSDMAPIFEQRPELVEKISEIVIQRKLHNENMKTSAQENTKVEQSLVKQLANRIRNFFKKSPSDKESNK